MKRKKNDALIIISILLFVALITCFLIFYFHSKNDEKIISGGDETVVVDDDKKEDPVNPITTDDDETQEASSVVVTDEEVNAYDYILEIMNQPQYWSEDEYFPPYSAPWYTEEAKETLINGTGWYLKDEETATFERGYLSKFSINFSEHIAMTVNELDDEVYYFDFENDVYYWEKSGNMCTMDRVNKLKGSEWYWQCVVGMADLTFSYYEEIFEAAGCSLLNQPAGTLASYKDVTANRVALIDDGLIHAPWKQEGFTFAWEEHIDEVEWLDDYREILNKTAPESELQSINWCDRNNSCSTKQYAKYSPLYLVIADKNESQRYLTQDGSYWYESLSTFGNITEALAVYYLAPAIEEVYGYTGVYFTDKYSLTGQYYAMAFDTREEFVEGIYYDLENEDYNAVITTYNVGEVFTTGGYTTSYNNTEFIQLFDRVREIYDYYGKEYKYGDDYLGNFMLCYSIEEQLILGLR